MMGLSSREEKASYDFYMWEYRYRGYGCFDYTVPLDVPYVPFPLRNYSYTKGYDDGKVPSVLKRFQKLLTPSTETAHAEIVYEYPTEVEHNKDLKVLVVSFPQGAAIDAHLSRELLTSLSFTKHLTSFEIIGTGESITIQLCCHEYDMTRVESHLAMLFPESLVKNGDQFNLPFDPEGSEIAIIDFGLEQEFMLPIRITDSFGIDPLTSIFALLESITENSCVVFQIMSQGVNTPLSRDITYASSDGQGGSFFPDFPELITGAIEKTSSPLLSTIIRVAIQGNSRNKTEYLAKECITNICSSTEGSFNRLIPLSNEGYEYNTHVMNVFYRASNRHGMILSVNELVTLLHFPHNSIYSPKLFGSQKKTKALSSFFSKRKYVLGRNIHNGIESIVSLDDEERLKHTHVIGATGVGKSTLLANMILGDIHYGNGCALFDPHGDIVEDILLRIPKERKNDVVIIDPSDTQFPVGFNLLHADNEAEKMVLSSDLVSAFRSHATSWGDTMTSVLSNAIDTFLDSSTGGTLIELKRFLLEDTFRKKFLHSVSDPLLLYYWNHEYAMVRKRISPLLTRMDTFLRPKIIRSMMVQKEGVNLSKALHEKKIILFKLSVGLIGKENAALLGSLFLSKLSQVAHSRQGIPEEERHPFYVYIDECHHLMSPSICDMLSGTRKYGMGLILAHQNIAQIHDEETLELMLSMPFTRVCFRLGELDAKRLESTLSFFDQNDLTRLSRGETIIRLGGSQDDASMNTFPLTDQTDYTQKDTLVQYSQSKYGTPIKEIEALLASLYSSPIKPEREKVKDIDVEEHIDINTNATPEDLPQTKPSQPTAKKVSDEDQNEIIQRAKKHDLLREHRKIQTKIKKLGQEYGFVSVVEYELTNKKRIDVSLERNDIRIACEISVSNTVSYELSNIRKCFEAHYDLVLVISDQEQHLKAIRTRAKKEFSSPLFKRILFTSSEEVKDVLISTVPKQEPKVEIIKGFRIRTEFEDTDENEAEHFRKAINRILKKKR